MSSYAKTGIYGTLTNELYTVTTLGIVCQCIAIVLAILVILSLFLRVGKIHTEEQVSTLVLDSISFVLSLALLVLSLVMIGCADNYNQYLNTTDISFKYVSYNVIFTMVMATLCLAYSIVQKVLQRKQIMQ